jgi:hypothetical protein
MILNTRVLAFSTQQHRVLRHAANLQELHQIWKQPRPHATAITAYHQMSLNNLNTNCDYGIMWNKHMHLLPFSSTAETRLRTACTTRYTIMFHV